MSVAAGRDCAKISPRSSSRSTPAAGFTLMEVLVVVMIMGLMAGLASTIMRPRDGELLHIEAERLAQLLDFAVAESRTTGKPVGWTAESGSYRFWRYRGGMGWSEIHDSDLLRMRTLPQGMMISGLRVESLPRQGAMRLEFSPYREALSFAVELSLGTERYAVMKPPVGDVRVVHGHGGGQAR